MKTQSKKELWQSWLQDILTDEEYAVFYYYSHFKRMDKVGHVQDMSSTARKRLLKSSMEKIQHYFVIYTAIVEQAKLHLYNRQQFLLASLEDLYLTPRTYRLLNSVNLKTMNDVISFGIDKLMRIRGFGDQSLIEIKTMLKYKGCDKLLR